MTRAPAGVDPVPTADRGGPAAVRAAGPFTETVDGAQGVIAAHGHLTPCGADLIRGTADVLRRSGHRQITVDLRDVAAADPGALADLEELRRDLRQRRGPGTARLVVLPAQEYDVEVVLHTAGPTPPSAHRRPEEDRWPGPSRTTG
jgi:hypothetical protein